MLLQLEPNILMHEWGGGWNDKRDLKSQQKASKVLVAYPPHAPRETSPLVRDASSRVRLKQEVTFLPNAEPMFECLTSGHKSLFTS